MFLTLSQITLSAGAMAMARKPGFIIGPIVQIFSVVLNALFEFIYSVFPNGSFGLTIIVFTVFAKLIMIPLMLKQQISMKRLQKVQPEIQKINDKYKGKTDKEAQTKMSEELQQFYKDNNVSPFGSCLPLLIQMPIFFALFFVLQQASSYINRIQNIYTSIAEQIINFPTHMQWLQPLAEGKKGMTFDLTTIQGVTDLLPKLSTAEWTQFPQELVNQLQPLLTQKHNIEYFLGINLMDAPGVAFPFILLPIIAGITTYISSKTLSTTTTPTGDAKASAQAAQTTKTMNIMFPFFTAFITISMPAGLGIYWTVSNIFQIFQQLAINKYVMAQGEKGDA